LKICAASMPKNLLRLFLMPIQSNPKSVSNKFC
jgi:hypothetical protein